MKNLKLKSKYFALTLLCFALFTVKSNAQTQINFTTADCSGWDNSLGAAEGTTLTWQDVNERLAAEFPAYAGFLYGAGVFNY